MQKIGIFGAVILGVMIFINWREGDTVPAEMVWLTLACAVVGLSGFLRRAFEPGPRKPKPMKERPKRKFATPPTARVADIRPQPAERSMDPNLRSFVAKGLQAIQDEDLQR